MLRKLTFGAVALLSPTALVASGGEALSSFYVSAAAFLAAIFLPWFFLSRTVDRAVLVCAVLISSSLGWYLAPSLLDPQNRILVSACQIAAPLLGAILAIVVIRRVLGKDNHRPTESYGEDAP